MSKRNRLNVLALLLAMAVFVSISAGSAAAIGVTPGRTTVDFEPNLEKEVNFTILNNEHKSFNAFVYAEDELKDAITSDKNIVEFKETDKSKTFTYKFKLPEKLQEPGDHWAKIIIMEMPSATEQKPESQVVLATTAVVHQLRVKVPYPGKYADLDLVVNEAEPNEDVNFFVKVFNIGSENIYKAFATVDILGATNEKIATVESEQIAVESKKTGEIAIPWKAEVNPGIYHAVVTVNYDGEVRKIEKNFAVGAMRVEIIDVKVRNFVLGGIAKFEINMENKWNQKISNVFAEIVMSSQAGDQVASFKSSAIDVDPLQRATLYAYWDTEGIEKGAYDAKLILHYGEKTSEKLLKTYVNLESIETEIVGITAKVITAKGGAVGPGADILVPLVLILVMINAGWFFYFRRRKK
jgi:methionine-rich copper-binding protein CopC